MNRKIFYPITVSTKISEETAKNLNLIAQAEKQTPSETIRKILEDYLE